MQNSTLSLSQALHHSRNANELMFQDINRQRSATFKELAEMKRMLAEFTAKIKKDADEALALAEGKGHKMPLRGN